MSDDTKSRTDEVYPIDTLCHGKVHHEVTTCVCQQAKAHNAMKELRDSVKRHKAALALYQKAAQIELAESQEKVAELEAATEAVVKRLRTAYSETCYDDAELKGEWVGKVLQSVLGLLDGNKETER